MQTESDRISRIRQSLRQLAEEIQELVTVFNDRHPLLKGTVYEQRRKCGKPNCSCASGDPHSSMMLSRSDQGRTKLMTIPSGYLKDFQVMTEHYQRFRRARARLGQIYKEMIKLIDQMEKARRKES